VVHRVASPHVAGSGPPKTSLLGPAGLAGGAESPACTGKGRQALVPAVGAPDPDESVQGIAAIHELLDHPLGDGPQNSKGVLKLLFIHAEEGFPVILEESIEGIFRKTPRSIRHDRMSGGRVMGGGVSGEVHTGGRLSHEVQHSDPEFSSLSSPLTATIGAEQIPDLLPPGIQCGQGVQFHVPGDSRNSILISSQRDFSITYIINTRINNTYT